MRSTCRGLGRSVVLTARSWALAWGLAATAPCVADPLYNVVNITESAVTDGKAISYWYNAFTAVPEWNPGICYADAYYSATAAADSTPPVVSTNSVIATTSSTGGSLYPPAFYGSWGWAAFRLDVKPSFIADLRSFDAAEYPLVWLEWERTRVESNAATNRMYRLLTPGSETTIDAGLQHNTWPPGPGSWEEWSTASYGTTIEEPEIWALQLNREARVDELRPDQNKSVGDPINTINGNVAVDATDIAIPCPGVPLLMRRSYNSMSSHDSALGARWGWSYDWHLSVSNTVFSGQTNTWCILRTGEGGEYSFPMLTNGTYGAPIEVNWRLVFTNQQYRVRMPGGIQYTFATNGLLDSIDDEWNNRVSLVYSNASSGSRLSRVEHCVGQYLALAYDSNDRVIAVNTPDPNLWVAYGYDTSGGLTNVVRHVGNASEATRYEYDGGTNHHIVKRVNSAGDAYNWTYSTNASGHTTGKAIRSWVASNSLETALEYPAAGTPKTVVTLGRGDREIEYEYYYHPVLKRILQVRGPNPDPTNGFTGVETRFSHDDGANTTNRTVVDLDTGDYLMASSSYDGAHNVTREGIGYCAAASNFWTYGWDTNAGLLTSVVDPEGSRIECRYTNASPACVKVFHSSTQSFDTTFGYYTNGLLAAVTNANGHWVRYGHDELGRCSGIEPQAGPAVSLSNNVLGHLVSLTMPGSGGERIVRFDADELGRVKAITWPNGLDERFAYDAVGNLTNHVAAGRTTRLTYLPARNLSTVERLLGPGTALTNAVAYDQQFNVRNLTDAKGRLVESYSLDLQDRPVTATNLEGQTMSVCRGVAGFVKSVTRFDGTTISNAYNPSGRLSQVLYADDTQDFTYLRNGLLQTAADGAGTISNAYDQANRLSSVRVTGSLPQPLTVSYGYAPAGNVTNVTSGVSSVRYAYDAAERVTDLMSQGKGFRYTYDPCNGLVSTMTCTNTGVVASYGYDVMDRVTNIAWRTSAGEVLRNFAYGRDAMGMVTNVVREDGARQAYSYDALDQLGTERRIANGMTNTVDYAYDPVGNRTNKSFRGTTVSYAMSAGNNRLSGWTASSTDAFAGAAVASIRGHSTESIGLNSGLGRLWVSNTVDVATPSVNGANFAVAAMPLAVGTNVVCAAIGDAAGNVGHAAVTVRVDIVTDATYQYSAAGCLTNLAYSGVGISGTNTLSWNSRYELIGVTTNGMAAESYGYDVAGRRVWTCDGTVTNWHVYDGAHVIADVDGTGGLIRTYLWGPGIDTLLAMTIHTGAVEQTYYALTDHLGSVHAFADEAGAVVEAYTFDAWGRVLSVTDGAGAGLSRSLIGNRYLWQGREYSWNTRLYNFRARWYDPVTGHWLSNDPIGISGGLNQYVFCGNNPVNFRDPFGLCTDDGYPAFVNPTYAFPGLQSLMPEMYDFLAEPGWNFNRWHAENIGIPVNNFMSDFVGADRWQSFNNFMDFFAQGMSLAMMTQGGAMGGGRPLLGQNPSRLGQSLRTGSRVNTRLSAGRGTARSIFRNQVQGPIQQAPLQNGGVRRWGANGVQIRMNPNGTTRVDLPGRGPTGMETIHFGT